MPKMKTNSSAKKRFSLTGTGKIARKNAYKSHILTKMSTKRKRNLGQTSMVSELIWATLNVCLQSVNN
jgi:large subunit ribosomal protein L35